MTPRLAIFTTHPIHYQLQLFRRLQAAGEVDARVLFACRFGMENAHDPTLGDTVRWYDEAILEGVPHTFLTTEAERLPRWDAQRNLAVARALRRALRERAYDAVVLYGYASYANWAAMATCRAAGLPVILGGETMERQRSGPVAWAKRAFLPSYLRSASAYLPIGTQSERFYLARGVKAERMFRTPYAVDNDLLLAQADALRPQRAKIRAEVGLAPDRPVVLFLGKVIARKRPEDLLEAFRRHRPDATLLVVGGGDDRARLERKAVEAKVDARFLGFQPPTTLARFYAVADVFAFPSSFETWGLVVNEAMCFSLPVVTTTAVPAATDLVRDGENGYVHAVGDVDTLGARLDELVRDPSRARKMGERSREIVSRWSHDESARNLARAARLVCGGPPA